MWMIAAVWLLVLPAFVNAGRYKPADWSKPKKGALPKGKLFLAEETETRRRHVITLFDRSTRADWIGAGHFVLNKNGALAVDPEVVGPDGPLEEAPAKALLHRRSRQNIMCAGLCGFRVNLNPDFGGWCCVNCCMWQCRADADLQLHNYHPHGDSCGSRRYPNGRYKRHATSHEDWMDGQRWEYEAWTSGDEAEQTDFVAPPSFPLESVMSDEAVYRCKEENPRKKNKKWKEAEEELEQAELEENGPDSFSGDVGNTGRRSSGSGG